MTTADGWPVLSIDDEKDIREVTALTLMDAGYQVDTAADGAEGLARCEKFAPRIVITDIRMPGMDGIQVLETIKQRFPDVNIHGFSPPEIYHFTKVSKLPLRDVLARLRDAGLGSLPGGGAEILVDRVRREITRGKVLTDVWLDVNRVWHELGGRSTATMMFGASANTAASAEVAKAMTARNRRMRPGSVTMCRVAMRAP